MTLVYHPQELKEMSQIMHVRLFPFFQKRIRAFVAEHPDRWKNESAFVRAALMRFFKELETEEARSRVMMKVR